MFLKIYISINQIKFENNMSNNEKGLILMAIIFAIAISIIISRELFPFFLFLTIISLIGFVGIILIELVSKQLGHFSKYVVFILLVLSILTLITWFIGYGIGGTPLGEACVEIYTTITETEQQVNEEVQNAINTLVNESCESLDEQSCNILKTTTESAQTLQEVTNKDNQLKSLSR
ncbi:hypothetical protein HN652_05085 [archaeon]|nr:hypothetical protein [archaeon]MBT7508365.1 hypothetical protein [archaeon]